LTEWKLVKLGELADEITVGFVGKMAAEYVPSGVPFLRSFNIEPFKISMANIAYISEAFHAKLNKSALRPGDVVIVRTGSPGVAAVVPEWLEDSNCSDLVIVRPGNNLDSKFLAYYINSVTGTIASAHSVGAVQQHFNVGSAKELEISLPSLHEQKKISGVLGLLDEKIELLYRMNKTLESLVTVLFKSWFEADDAMETWEIRNLSEVVEYLSRGIGPSYLEGCDGVCVLNQRCIRDRWVDLSKSRRHDHRAKKIDGREIMVGDVLINSTGVGTLGRVAQVLHLDEQTIVDSHVTVVRGALSAVLPEYLGCNLMGREAEIEALGTGSTGQTELSRERVGQLKIVVPPYELQTKFAEVVRPMNELRVSNARESTLLQRMRNLLIPQIISGKIRLGEAITAK
jgi:type I restriction enzyme, S subunit